MEAKNKPTGRDSDKFMLRLPDGMRDRIAAEAKKNNRSMNAEIVTRLDQSISQAAHHGITDQMFGQLTQRGREVMLSLYKVLLESADPGNQPIDVEVQNPDGTITELQAKAVRHPALRPSPGFTLPDRPDEAQTEPKKRRVSINRSRKPSP